MNEHVETCSPYPPGHDDGTARPFNPAWRSVTVLDLAKGIVADNAYDRLPILADALKEAGCDDTVLLSHCRECEQHEAGCWLVKSILFPAHDVASWTAKIDWYDDGMPSIYSPEFQQAVNTADRSLVRTGSGVSLLSIILAFCASCVILGMILKNLR